MKYLYLDESGDLGFDFVNKRPSKYFTITILKVNGQAENRKLIKAVEKTLARKLNPRGKRERIVHELKGTGTELDIKKYFYQQVKDIDFCVYALTLNKRRVYDSLTTNKERVYNFIARQVIDRVPFEQESGARIEFILDRCKSKPEIEEFNSYIRNQLQARINPNMPLDIFHQASHENRGLQACDIFCWGIFQKHERKNESWYKVYKEKIRYDDIYLPEK
ncbi:MAG: hypothetical protein UT41_C0002G0035 [Candidatus Wolfebacteria bacterium GW2011_GWC2_39_22]|uniref:DUF3800 domain-containing protein n=1 Tax=Candidatus Wolfebacteria bacterium GW2011_GWC2_39_22 TaxID=1619013 RepID=A0A0G0NHH8_9BACT|nr:MAG: hypothetical protein UT41_C0002G0035 [Candidatus Wolfebacteria bacterium GW2011_GWC2_39_22]HBI25895.1 hypothetical protein [Candidatus Wolfebacteria bacterium]